MQLPVGLVLSRADEVMNHIRRETRKELSLIFVQIDNVVVLASSSHCRSTNDLEKPRDRQGKFMSVIQYVNKVHVFSQC